MVALILFGLVGLAITYFALQNTGGVPITLANYTFYGIPLYLLVIGSVLLGVAMSWIISLVNTVGTMFTLHSKDAALHQAHKVIEELKKENAILAKENMSLKHTKEESPAHPDYTSPSIAQRFKQAMTSAQ